MCVRFQYNYCEDLAEETDVDLDLLADLFGDENDLLRVGLRDLLTECGLELGLEVRPWCSLLLDRLLSRF